MINSQEIKIGTCIRMDGGIWKCIDFQHRKPGKGNTVMNTKLKNVADGRVLERTFQVGFKLDDVRVEHRPYQYLYVDVVTDTTDGTILSAEMPVKTILKVVHSEPGIKGNTATNATKPATLESGVEIRVPLFINEGETIQVDTRDGSYLGRISE